MKKNYLFAALLLVSGASFSQSLSSTDIGYQVGESFNYYQTAYISPGASGTGVTWDFSSMSPQSTIGVDVTANSGGTFPSSNVKLTQSNGGTIYYNLNSSIMEVVGMEIPGVTFTYSNPTTYLQFPTTSTTNYTDPSACTFTTSGFNFSRTISTHTQFSGYGTLITPEGTFTNVVRLESVQTIVDTYSMGTINSTVTAYNWYKAGVHHELANVSTTSSSSGTTQSAYYAEVPDNLGLENNTLSNLIMFPNPANSNVTISTDTQISSIAVYTLSGQEVLNMEVNGLNTAELNIENLNSGVYLVKVLGSNGELSVERLCKN